MAGWDGSGNFVLNYQFVQDAANGIKILASRQDTQWTTVATGLMNCLTRDGQTAPTANISWNGFKLQNLGAPAVPTDAARLVDIGTAFSEWKAETNSFSFVDGTHFKISGINSTAVYDPNRRLKIVHNAGATTSYFYVLSSSFAVDTTVQVNSGGPTIVSPITSISYSVLDAANLSTPFGGGYTMFNTTGGSLASNTLYNLGKTGTPFVAIASNDASNRFSAGSGVYTIPNGPIGWYLLNGTVTINKNGANVTSAGFLSCTGTNMFYSPYGVFPPFNVDNASTVSVSGILSGSVNPNLVVQVQSPTFTGGPVLVTACYMSIIQVA